MKKKVFNSIFIAVIVYSSLVLLKVYFTGRTLWLDEGMLAWSFTQRSLSNLISGPFEWLQSAPVLYLYIVKIITLILGNTELTLRLFSIICYFATIFLSYKLGKNLKYPLALCAFVAASSTMLRYANEFKPYISDCMAVLLVLYVYRLYKEDSLKIWALTLIYVVMIWFSNPSCFFIAGIIIIEFFKTPKKYFFVGLCCLISFALYFIVWLHPVISQGDMTDWWVNQYFPLIPKSKDDLHKAYNMFREISGPIAKPSLDLGIALMAIASFFKNVFAKKHDPVIYASFFGIFIALAASYLTFYPIECRLWLFVYPLMIYLVFWFIDSLEEIPVVILSFGLILSTNGAVFYSYPDNAYLPMEEINPIIEYVKDKKEFIYVYNDAVPTYCYKNNYIIPDNAMMGDRYFMEYNKDLDEIKKNDKGYIVISHPYGSRSDGLFSDLEKNNYKIRVVMEFQQTKLYYFSKNN